MCNGFFRGFARVAELFAGFFVADLDADLEFFAAHEDDVGGTGEGDGGKGYKTCEEAFGAGGER